MCLYGFFGFFFFYLMGGKWTDLCSAGQQGRHREMEDLIWTPHWSGWTRNICRNLWHFCRGIWHLSLICILPRLLTQPSLTSINTPQWPEDPKASASTFPSEIWAPLFGWHQGWSGSGSGNSLVSLLSSFIAQVSRTLMNQCGLPLTLSWEINWRGMKGAPPPCCQYVRLSACRGIRQFQVREMQ